MGFFLSVLAYIDMYHGPFFLNNMFIFLVFDPFGPLSRQNNIKSFLIEYFTLSFH